MFNKILDKHYETFIMKIYRTDIDFYSLIGRLMESGVPIDSVSVSEDVDMDMRVYTGCYSYDEFLEKYDDFQYDIDSATFFFKDFDGNVTFNCNDDIIRLITHDPSIELDDIMKPTYKKS